VAILTVQSEEDGSGQCDGGRDGESSSTLELVMFQDFIYGTYSHHSLVPNVHLDCRRGRVSASDCHLRAKPEIACVSVCLCWLRQETRAFEFEVYSSSQQRDITAPVSIESLYIIRVY